VKKVKVGFLFKAVSGWLGAGTYNHIRHWVNGLYDQFDLYLINCWKNQEQFLSYFGKEKVKSIYLPELACKIFIYPAIKVANVLKEYQIDILHTIGLHSDIIGALSTFFYRPPLFISSVETYLTGCRCPWCKKFLYRNLFYPIVKRRVDVISAISTKTSLELQRDLRTPSKKIYILHSGIDVTVFEPVSERWPFKGNTYSTAPKIGMIGRLSEEKGGSLFLEAARYIVRIIPDATFIICGDGPEKKKLIYMAQNYGIYSQVHFIGWIKDPREFYSQIDILVVPAPKVCDGLPWVVLEALATYTPIVATNGGGISDAIKHRETGILVNCDDPYSLGEGVIWLWNHPEEARNMCIKGRELIEKYFNTEREIKQLKKIYLDNLEKHIEK